MQSIQFDNYLKGICRSHNYRLCKSPKLSLTVKHASWTEILQSIHKLPYFQYLLNKEWAVRRTPLMTWKSPLWKRFTISVSKSGHFWGKSSRPMILMASLNCKGNGTVTWQNCTQQSCQVLQTSEKILVIFVRFKNYCINYLLLSTQIQKSHLKFTQSHFPELLFNCRMLELSYKIIQ